MNEARLSAGPFFVLGESLERNWVVLVWMGRKRGHFLGKYANFSGKMGFLPPLLHHRSLPFTLPFPPPIPHRAKHRYPPSPHPMVRARNGDEILFRFWVGEKDFRRARRRGACLWWRSQYVLFYRFLSLRLGLTSDNIQTSLLPLG